MAPTTAAAWTGLTWRRILARTGACHAGEARRHLWRGKLRKLVCLGAPHHGSPLERGGNWLDALLGVSSYSAPFQRLSRIRSAGVTDLRFGNVLDEHWQGVDRFARHLDLRGGLPLPAGVDCYAIAATKAPVLAENLPGDGLVPVASALGRHEKPGLTLAFPEGHQWIALSTGHLDLLSSPAVYAQLRSWLAV